MTKNTDPKTVESFGDEWSRYDQSEMSIKEAEAIFSGYFAIFPWDTLPVNAVGFDMGCGTGRWARHVAPRVGRLHCIDPSIAINVARRNLGALGNVVFHRASVDDDSLPPESQDFGYSLGVLHHIPDTRAALQSCVKLLKPGAPFLLYLYYAFDNRPVYFRAIWKITEIGRAVISKMPNSLKVALTTFIAGAIYWPLAKLSSVLERMRFKVENIPLSFYRSSSFYTMRTDARDRFGTPLEQRFARNDIAAMMEQSGLINVRFSESAPYWCAVGIKR